MSGEVIETHALQIIYKGQGEQAVRDVLESPGQPGENLRQHAAMCIRCALLVRQIYTSGEIPVKDDFLAVQLQEIIEAAE